MCLVRLSASEIHYAFRGRLVSLLVLTHCGVSPRPFLPQESPCISSAGIAFTTISYSSTSTKININHITSSGERRVVTPAGKATAEDPGGSGLCFRGSTSVARGKHPPGSIPDGSNSTRIRNWKSTCPYVAVYINSED